MKPHAALGILSLLVCHYPAISQEIDRPDSPQKAADVAMAAKKVFEATNQFRKGEGRSELKENAELKEAAAYFAKFMASTDKYGHEADGKSPADRARDHKYDFCGIEENIAYVYSSEGYDTGEVVQGLVEGWKKSPGHRRNMLEPDMMEAGMAVARSEKSGKYYGVQMFGRPRSAAIEFQVANEAGEDVKYQVGDQSLTLGPHYIRTHTDCRPVELKFAGAGSEGQAETFRPVTGDLFVISKKDGSLRVSREKAKREGSPAAEGH
jgi:uncharacterized protein YkwD